MAVSEPPLQFRYKIYFVPWGGGRQRKTLCQHVCHLIISPGPPPYNMGKRRVPEVPTLHSPEGAKSLCVPAHTCASSCLAGFHPQLAPTCLPRARTQQPQAASRCPHQALAPCGISHRPHPHAPSIAHTAFTSLYELNEEPGSGKEQSHPRPSLPPAQTGRLRPCRKPKLTQPTRDQAWAMNTRVLITRSGPCQLTKPSFPQKNYCPCPSVSRSL